MKQSFEQLLTKAKRYLVTVGWLLSMLETVLALVAGGLVGSALSGGLAWPAWVSGLLYLLFFGVKLYGQALFPASLFGELQAQEELERTKADLNRQNQIFGNVNQSIIALNKQTCSVSVSDNPRVCDEAVIDGLRDLLRPVIEHPQYLLNCDSTRFTVAVRVEHYSEVDDFIRADDRIYLLRDDLKLSVPLGADADGIDALEDLNASGMRMKLRNALQASLNNNTFHNECIVHDDSSFSLAVGPIPLVCEVDGASGVLMIATDSELACPCDLSAVLGIYGRLIANWLSKHDECLFRKHGLYDTLPGPDNSNTTPSNSNES